MNEIDKILNSYRINDPIKDLLDSYKSYQTPDHWKELREAAISSQFNDPMKEYRESISSSYLSDTLSRIHDSSATSQLAKTMEKIHDSINSSPLTDMMRDIQDTISSYQTSSPMQELYDSIHNQQYSDPLKEFRESMSVYQASNPIRDFTESMQAYEYPDPMKELRESLFSHRFNLTTSELENSVFSLVESIAPESLPTAYELDTDLKANSDGSISIGENSIAYEELQEIVTNVVSNSIDTNNPQLENEVTRLLNEIRSLKEPFIQKLLVMLIFPIIVGLVLSIINPITDHYIKEYLSNGEKRAITSKVKKTINSSIKDKSLLSSYRIVTANILNVRKSASRKSTIVGKLYFSDAVQVLQKDRNWTLIQYQDMENTYLIKGWVFTRYLKTIN